MKVIQIVLFGLLFVSMQALANVSVKDGWVRLLPPMVKTTAAYMTITSSDDDRLLSVSSPQAERVELHLSSMENGVMSMDHIEHIDLKKGKPLLLSPGAYHFMLKGLKKSLREGDRFQLRLQFDKAGELELTLPVKR